MKEFPDFGNVRDNESAFHIALYSIQHGDKEWGREVLLSLRDHICSTNEIKSVHWILPEVLRVLKELDSSRLTPNTSEQLVRV